MDVKSINRDRVGYCRSRVWPCVQMLQATWTKFKELQCCGKHYRPWVSWAHVKNSCDSGGLMSFQTGVPPEKKREHNYQTRMDLMHHQWEYFPFESIFPAWETCWIATNLYRQPGTTVWKEGLITANHLENDCSSEVWQKHWDSSQTAWKKREFCEYVCTCCW